MSSSAIWRFVWLSAMSLTISLLARGERVLRQLLARPRALDVVAHERALRAGVEERLAAHRRADASTRSRSATDLSTYPAVPARSASYR